MLLEVLDGIFCKHFFKIKNFAKINKKAVLSQRWPCNARYISGSNEPLRRYNPSKLSKMAACCQLGFDVTGNSAIWSTDPENPTLEPNMKCVGSPVVYIRPFESFQDGGRPAVSKMAAGRHLGFDVTRSIWNPHFGEGEVIGVSDGTIRKSNGGFL